MKVVAFAIFDNWLKGDCKRPFDSESIKLLNMSIFSESAPCQRKTSLP